MTALSPILLSLYLDGFLWWKLLDSHGNLVPFFQQITIYGCGLRCLRIANLKTVLKVAELVRPGV